MRKLTAISAATLMLSAGSAFAQSIPQVPAGAPAAGVVGLGLLTLAVAGGGAYLLRRK